MPDLAAHQSSVCTKLLLVGDSGSGKTGSLASLADAGYNLRILDLDNGLDVLHNLLADPKSPYNKDSLQHIKFKTITEPMKQMGGQIVPAKAQMWNDTIKMLEHWKDGEEDLGKLTIWTDRDVLVLDSLTRLARAAYNHHMMLNGKLTGATQNEARRGVWQAQVLIESLLQMLYDVSIKCNIIVISHITLTDDETQPLAIEGEPKPKIGYPSAIGAALGPKISQYFNSVLLAKTIGTGSATKRKLFTKSQGIVPAKSSAPLRTLDSYPIETGLAQYFAAVRGEQPTKQGA